MRGFCGGWRVLDVFFCWEMEFPSYILILDCRGRDFACFCVLGFLRDF